MTNRKRAFWATTALFSGLLLAGAASAQSTGSQTVEATELGEVVVTGTRGPRNIGGAIVAEQVGKSRSTITQDFISTQAAGQTVLQSLNLMPGVNFTNQDAYGNSGGDITIRGFDAQRISLNLDGIQLNDTGNYQIYSNQQLDPELLERASVNQGTTDVDSPTASATGGTINLITRRPAREFGGIIQPSFGDDNYKRIFALVDTGEIGPWGTTAWFSTSATTYDQFGNPGDLSKQTYNGRIYQPLGDNGDFLSLAAHYNRNRNNTYGGKNVDRFNAGTIDAGNGAMCLFDPAGPGRQNQATSSATVNPGCGTYYGWFINPSDTFNVRGQARISLTDQLTLTVDPTYQYVMANGGGVTNIDEWDQRLQGSQFDATSAATRASRGVDLNGDGDILDTIKLYSPSNTNTNRYSVNSSLIYDINDDHRVRLSYTFDSGNHRQTGEYGFLSRSGNPLDPWAGHKNGGQEPILTLDGDIFQKRDRRSKAVLNQVSFQYVGNFLDDALTLDIGVRAPFFHRELTNYCYQQDTFNAYCSAQTPFSAPTAGAPVSFERDYDAVLPNVGATWRFAENMQLFGSYSENLSAPRTDDLYDRIPASPEPETSKNYDLGYRYQSGRVLASVSGYVSKFDNYIARGLTDVLDVNGDPTGETIATNVNVGAVDRWGADGQIGFYVMDDLMISGSVSYLGSEIKNNIPGQNPSIAGKELFEVPEWQYGARAEYTIGDFTFGLQGKFVGERWTNLVNDEKTPEYAVFDLDARWDLEQINEGMWLQVNVLNLFDEVYLGNISTEVSGNRTANLGAPRTAMATLRMTF
ncbi:TonB-dependent receptor domain-containing protein [Brevundimonas lenta]|uniref:Iron complex outermembrane receptor protein n=1 Tax=Brevundimonas lenta TaxID=424796 RepID=A0A7W6NP48_9CAUL|nr:TonB-dependent receptor [Brevundimonas lenta]MBB4081827.1 iron complex outermembrane receptor protein [Brevundimonas lenta]